MNRPNTLTAAIIDIATDFNTVLARKVLAQPPGPNSWDTITKADYGNEFDFELYEREDTTVFYPVSRAALQFCYRFLPADCPRWRGIGFVVENEWIDLIVRQARHYKLVYLGDAMAENDNLSRQWEGLAED